MAVIGHTLGRFPFKRRSRISCVVPRFFGGQALCESGVSNCIHASKAQIHKKGLLMVTQICSKCSKEKDLGCFSFKNESLNTHHKYCKECHKVNVFKVKRILRAFKVKHGCQICGYNTCHWSLHFHHIEPADKLFEISMYNRIHSSKITEELHNELRKCLILCCNCHMEVDHKITKIGNLQPLWENNYENM